MALIPLLPQSVFRSHMLSEQQWHRCLSFSIIVWWATPEYMSLHTVYTDAGIVMWFMPPYSKVPLVFGEGEQKTQPSCIWCKQEKCCTLLFGWYATVAVYWRPHINKRLSLFIPIAAGISVLFFAPTHWGQSRPYFFSKFYSFFLHSVWYHRPYQIYNFQVDYEWHNCGPTDFLLCYFHYHCNYGWGFCCQGRVGRVGVGCEVLVVVIVVVVVGWY